MAKLNEVFNLKYSALTIFIHSMLIKQKDMTTNRIGYDKCTHKKGSVTMSGNKNDGLIVRTLR